MSGVNGGIDYEIDLTTLPPSLASRISYVQNGPDSPTALISAAEEIALASKSHPQTLPVLVDMLGFNNPAAAGIAIAALVDAGDLSIPSLLTGVAAFNYSVNAYALRALAGIGNPSVLQVCLACANSGPIPNVRRAACRALGSLHYTANEHARTAYECLLTLADKEADWGVRYAAIVALEHFEAISLLDRALKELGLRVVLAAAEGNGNVLNEQQSEEGKENKIAIQSDPTVAARATVALETMRQRLEASAGV
ncbi:Phycocyanobilin lyase subunit beta [Gracilariopsis chorda]|uniref:Phycocyanobilin lyase subunit beta n=1 Tax=Gracilariopsis chorda TaxID=448386 RepID=A0A2V3J5M3_9FLOR|nr:Phycocyanobilin lyase subunit beta [Gracilariopsis chorda]|eukprot:PXF49422.1 Phycocyanobilin lyase subunit beta [Gracilariopsis chorda]